MVTGAEAHIIHEGYEWVVWIVKLGKPPGVYHNGFMVNLNGFRW